ncbi:hypothetical protein HAHE_40240 [Haloferula helveola]|uniref:Uncharacterized protein n=1 Tax=Haloferula helveola TaxID=490095 RepID=A0ABN6H8X0_9BACT|nr:hypothetical protein HAHE_40240 [Haloferula helveola]
MKQLVIGGLLIVSVGLLAIVCWLARGLPGFFGEWFGVIAGIVSTPFLMEASFVLIGLMLVLAVNHWRQQREGDEFVYLEQVEGPEAETLPDSARWAVYREAPLDVELPGPLDEIEGLIEAGEYAEAENGFATLPTAELQSTKVVALRIRLAEATGNTALAKTLRQRAAGEGH